MFVVRAALNGARASLRARAGDRTVAASGDASGDASGRASGHEPGGAPGTGPRSAADPVG